MRSLREYLSGAKIVVYHTREGLIKATLTDTFSSWIKGVLAKE
jgi:hypothetical protein